MKTIVEILESRVTQAMQKVTGLDNCPGQVRSSNDPRFGDYQANGVMAIAKRMKKNPRDLAADIVAALEVDDISEVPEIAGPGFINFKLKEDYLATRLMATAKDDTGRLAIDATDSPETIVVDFSAPNIAKRMHVGHLRSTIIGDCISRMLDFEGHNVIRQNHIGDWGTQFGRVILGLWYLCMAEKRNQQYYRTELEELKACGEDKEKLKQLCQNIHKRHVEDYEEDYVDEPGDGKKFFRPYLDRLENSNETEIWSQFLEAYQYVNLLEESVTGMNLELPTRQIGDIQHEALPRHITVMLQDRDDPRNDQEFDAWKFVRKFTLEYCSKMYERLSALLSDDDVRGESFYNDRLPGIVDKLKVKGLATESDGAICIFLDGFKNRDNEPLPFIIQKSDGAFLYATTDLAAIKYRIDELKAKRIIYVTDARQKLHFQMLFTTTETAGWKDSSVKLEHVTFGSVLGENGKPLKTRSGENIKLSDLLDEAVTRAKAVVESKNPNLSDTEKDAIANAIGIGAIKYADYSNNRESDYVFSFDKMLAMDGNTAPYMQYAYARVKSIERKAADKGIDVAAELGTIETLSLTEQAELDLAKHLARYGEAIAAAAADCRPNYLTSYLYDLAQKFSSFYNACPVLIAGPDKRPTRLMLCDLTARTIKHGLSELLGIDVVEQM